jgi:hypothetical protein
MTVEGATVTASDGCIGHITEIWSGEYRAGERIGQLGIDSLTMLDWIFHVETAHGIEIPAAFFEGIDISGSSLETLHDHLISSY